MDFIEVQFPTDIKYNRTGGPSFFTSITKALSGYEQRNAYWAFPLFNYVITEVSTLADMEVIRDFFMAAMGRAYGFRFKDHFDFKSCPLANTVAATDMRCGTLTTTTFQLQKAYTKGGNTLYRQIQKPVNGTVLIADNGVVQTETTHYTVDYSTGVVTFLSTPTGPVTAGFEFDVPVRFDVDDLNVEHLSNNAVQVNLPLKEIRL